MVGGEHNLIVDRQGSRWYTVYCMETTLQFARVGGSAAVGVIEPRGLSEQVNDLLHEWIVNARLEPGQRLRESALAEELGVSRTPVREALKRLAADGFVTATARRGVYVSEIDSQRLEEILDLRYLLEMYAVERGAERISQQELREMRFLVEGCESLVESSDRLQYNRYVQRDCDLHRLIIRTTGNGLLAELYERLAVFLQIARVRLFEVRPSMARGHEEHKAVMGAYEARDKDRVLLVLGSHLRRSREEILEVAAKVTGE